jgi:hypothetical protein
MWIFTKQSFVSVIEHSPNVLLVRGRIKGDVERMTPTPYVKVTPDADYLFRSYVSRDILIESLARHVAGIDYQNFKATVDPQRQRAYTAIWNTMATLQDRLAAKPRLVAQ